MAWNSVLASRANLSHELSFRSSRVQLGLVPLPLAHLGSILLLLALTRLQLTLYLGRFLIPAGAACGFFLGCLVAFRPSPTAYVGFAGSMLVLVAWYGHHTFGHLRCTFSSPADLSCLASIMRTCVA